MMVLRTLFGTHFGAVFRNAMMTGVSLDTGSESTNMLILDIRMSPKTASQ